MAIAICKKALREIRTLVQVNDHGAAYQTAAKALGCDDLAEQFGSINNRHLKLGYIPLNLYDERHRLYQELLACARTNLNAGEYQKLYNSL